MLNRRRLLLIVVAVLLTGTTAVASETKKRPNILLILTDDQGYGDLGFHGNPKIKTPNLDRFARRAVRMKHFHVSPVCSPTRASLLTGRYNYRTGVVDTFLGRSMMFADETTLAELLAAVGYRCGIFGKWHLGDCYPMRPTDQGFHEALVHKGGGIAQPSDPPGGSSYFDPVLQHNGKQVQKKGYCSDVFTDAALEFMNKNRDGPFLCWLAYNAPHAPFQVPEKYLKQYSGLNLAHDQFPQIGVPLPGKADQDAIARVYGMITNIDDNLGRLLAKLDELGIADDTIVIFLTDNGAGTPRFNGGLRGFKTSVHEGGTRVPFFVRWPGHFPADRDVDRVAAHIDVTPTLLDACRVKTLANLKMDGRSLLPLWKGDKTEWPDRTLFFQWHRGDVPELDRACAARSQKYRLVQADGIGEKYKVDPEKVRFQLFDIDADPYEQRDLADKLPDVAAKMRREYEAWFKDVTGTRGAAVPRIALGSGHENPTVLTRQDWRGPNAGWTPKSLGYWEVTVETAGKYDVAITFPAGIKAGTLHFRLGDTTSSATFEQPTDKVTLPGLTLARGPARLEAWVENGGERRGALFVDVRKRP